MSWRLFRRTAVVVVLPLILLPLACSAEAGDGEEPIDLVVGHQLATDTPFDAGLNRFAELVEEKTDGRVVVRVYPSAQLGGEPDMFQGMQEGTVDAAVVAPGSLGEFVPELNLLSMPFLVTSREQRDQIIEGEVADRLERLVEERSGIRIMGYFGGGIRNMFFTHPASSMEDVRGSLLRIQPSRILADSFAAVGLEPTVLDYNELYNALQQGVVDGAENESVFVLSENFYEAAPHLLLTRHEVTIRPFMISGETLERLSDDLRVAVLEAGAEAAEYERELEAREDDEALDALSEEHGMEVTQVDIEPAIEAVEPVWERYAEEWDMEDVLQQMRDAQEEV